MMYEAPNTVMIDDLNEFVQYPYNDKEDLQTRQEVLACILVVEYDTNHCNKNPLILMRKSHRCVIRSWKSRNFWKRNTDIHYPSTYFINGIFGGFATTK